jgi:hypothetical protein
LVLNSVTSTPQWIRQPEAAWSEALCMQLGALKQLTLAWFHGLMQLPDSVVRSIIVALTAASARPLYQEVRRWVWDPETFAPGRSQRRCYPTGRCASVTDLQSFRDCQ